MTEEKKQQTSEDVKKSIYSTLSKIDVSHLIDKKMGLNYLSWAKAWGLVKSIYPDADKEITEYPEYLPTQNPARSCITRYSRCCCSYAYSTEYTR